MTLYERGIEADKYCPKIIYIIPQINAAGPIIRGTMIKEDFFNFSDLLSVGEAPILTALLK
ncbi:MAG: hypothetical protein KAH72_08520, partial [Flavobacteriaceae bacterium]|nr:hypothetical protein [Flavobacteriaceae bacterium]